MACKRDDTGTPWGDWGWLYPYDASADVYSEALACTTPPVRTLTAEAAAARHLLFEQLARHPFSALLAEHVANLTARTLTDADVRRGGYFTFTDYSGRDQIAGDLARFVDPAKSVVARRFNAEHAATGYVLWQGLVNLPGIGLRGVNGFQFTQTPKAACLAIPSRDLDGLIQGIRLRMEEADGGKRYLWLSSKTNPSGAPVHVAMPETLTDRTRIVLVEGELKADVVAKYRGCIVLGVPGISTTAGVVPLLEEMVKRGMIDRDATAIQIAYDQDSDERLGTGITKHENTHNAAKRLAAEIKAAHFSAIYLVEWDRADGKGLDDVLAHGGTARAVSFAPRARRKGLVRMRLDAAEPRLMADSIDSYATPEAANAALVDLSGRLLPNKLTVAGPRTHGFHLIRATTGVGKTEAMLAPLGQRIRGDAAQWGRAYEHERDGSWKDRPQRILYLCADRQTLREKTTQYVGATWRMSAKLDPSGTPAGMDHVWVPDPANPHYWVMEGRNRAQESTGFCENPKAEHVAGRRHLPAIDACAGSRDDAGTITQCPFYTTCAQTGYLAAKKSVNSADVYLVFACYDAYLNGSSELEHFDIVIIDEDATHKLLTAYQVTQKDVGLWRKLLNERDDTSEYTNLAATLQWWETASREAAVATDANDQVPVLPFLRAHLPAGRDGKHLLQTAIGSCHQIAHNLDMRRAICEEPRGSDPTRIPLRAIYDFATAVMAEWDRPEGADTRVRVSGFGTFYVREPNAPLLKRLSCRRVILLDATADTWLLERIVTDANATRDAPIKLTTYDYTVSAGVRLWQMTDFLYSRKMLTGRGASHVGVIAETLHALATARGLAETDVAVMTLKPLNADTEDPITDALKGFNLGHYGRDDKATNRYDQCRMLVSVGNYTPHIGQTEYVYTAWRFSATPPQPPEKGRKTTRHVGYDGTEWGVERVAHYDPDIQRAIDHAAWVHDTQALGRLRAVRRTDEDLVWLRFNKQPYDGLPVERLLTHDELRAELGLGTAGQAPRAQQMQGTQAANERKRAAAWEQCRQAAEKLEAEGKPITATALHKRTGLHVTTARAWIEAHYGTAERPQPSDFSGGVHSVGSILSNPNSVHPPPEIPGLASPSSHQSGLSHGDPPNTATMEPNDRRFRIAIVELRAMRAGVNASTIAAQAHAPTRDVDAWWRAHQHEYEADPPSAS